PIIIRVNRLVPRRATRGEFSINGASGLEVGHFFLRIPPTQRLCEKFVVRPSGGSLYLGFRLITNFRLKAELRTSCFHTVSALVGFGRENVQPPAGDSYGVTDHGHRGAIERSLLRSGGVSLAFACSIIHAQPYHCSSPGARLR